MDTSVIDLTLKALIGLTGVAVSILVYLHYRLQRNDSWLRDFRALHRLFWEDEDMATVRAWLANSEAYETIVETLKARRAIDEKDGSEARISIENYEHLEKLDKFCNLMISVQVLDPRFETHKELWKRLFVEYWVDQMFSEERSELRWYVSRFYRELETGWVVDAPRGRAEGSR